MDFGPKTVAPGYALRWYRQAQELLARAPHWWLLHGIFCVGAALIAPTILLFPLGMLFYFSATELAAELDTGHVSLSRFVHTFVKGAQGAALDLWGKRFILAGALAIAIGIIYYFSTSMSSEPSLRVVEEGSKPFSKLPLLGMALWAGAMLQGRALSLHCFSYPLTRLLGGPPPDMAVLLRGAARKNPKLTLLIDVGQGACIVFATLVTPWLLPVLFCIFPAYAYVAFREVFVDDRGNAAPQRQLETNFVTGETH